MVLADMRLCCVPRRYTIGRRRGTSRRRQLRRSFWGRRAWTIPTASSTWRRPLRRTPSPSRPRFDAVCGCMPGSWNAGRRAAANLLRIPFARGTTATATRHLLHWNSASPSWRSGGVTAHCPTALPLASQWRRLVERSRCQHRYVHVQRHEVLRCTALCTSFSTCPVF